MKKGLNEFWIVLLQSVWFSKFLCFKLFLYCLTLFNENFDKQFMFALRNETWNVHKMDQYVFEIKKQHSKRQHLIWKCFGYNKVL